MTVNWQPLSIRESGKPTELREGVPEGLAGPLREWIQQVARSIPKDVVEELAIRLDIDLDDFFPFAKIGERLGYAPPNQKLLDVADALLHAIAKRRSVALLDKRQTRRDLQRLLDNARSVYTVKPDGIGRRVDPKASQMLTQAVCAAQAEPDAGSAASQLREASDAVRAMHPDTKKAYRMAVTAVESAAHAVIEPNNVKATLGTMLGILAANPAAFEVEIAGKDRSKGPVAPVTGVMRMLWDGQTSRHGSKQPAREETREEAEMAVQLASLLVLWFTSGMVRRK